MTYCTQVTRMVVVQPHRPGPAPKHAWYRFEVMKHRDVLTHQDYLSKLKSKLHLANGHVQKGRHVRACAEASSFCALVYSLLIMRALRASFCGGGSLKKSTMMV